MSLYRAAPEDGVAWVTGASGGIGKALCLSLAKRGYRVAASARSADKLAALVAHPDAQGRIRAFALDVTDEAAATATFQRIEAEMGPVVLAVLNAGRAITGSGRNFQSSAYDKVYAVNVFGVTRCLASLIPSMKARGRGQIAIIGSLTAYFGLPTAAAYASTKAAVNMIAQSLRFDLRDANIRVQIVNPGFVETAMTDGGTFPKPAMITAEAAGERIANGLERGWFEISFPRRLLWPMKLIRLLPHGLRHEVIYQVYRRLER